VTERVGGLALLSACFPIENLSEAGEEMIPSIGSIAAIIFAFFFTIFEATLE
jgi:hypothetical protein